MLAPLAHPAHALLSVAHALLGPASALAKPDTPTLPHEQASKPNTPTLPNEQAPKPPHEQASKPDTAHDQPPKQTNVTNAAAKTVTFSNKDNKVDPSLLPIEQQFNAGDDVSDLRDVVDAINKLCETMKTSYAEYEDCEDAETVDNESIVPNTVIDIAEYWSESELGMSPEIDLAKPVPRKAETCIDTSYVVEPVVSSPEAIVAEPVIFETCKIDRLRDAVVDSVVLSAAENIKTAPQYVESYEDSGSETVNEPALLTSEPIFEKVKTYKSERSDTIEQQKPMTAKTDAEIFKNIVAERFEELDHITSDVETGQCEPMSEMYYTASSEVSLLSDVDFQEKAQTEESDKEKDDRNSVMAGHVAAMRERFESMTRTNTPCPDLMRSTSPSFEVFRNFSSSPDPLD